MYSDRELPFVRSQLAEILGYRDFNRMIGWVDDVRAGRRFRYHQEQLLRKAGDAGFPLEPREVFLEVFQGAERVPEPTEPWTRERFLAAIEKNPHCGFSFDETPPEWMAEAWEINRVRDEQSYGIARYVSKLGELVESKEYLEYLSRALPISRQVELFLYIRNRSPNIESQFRGQFERAFPACVPQLPPARTEAEIAAMYGLTVDEYRLQRQMPQHGPNGPPAHIDEDDIPF